MKIIKVNSKELYYGANKPDIKNLRIAEEDTIVSGVYLTSDKNIALGYAKHRSVSNGIPTVYTVIVSKTKFLDLTDNNTLQEVMDGFLEILKKRTSGGWAAQNVRQEVINIINNK